jgi:hypothetical protein
VLFYLGTHQPGWLWNGERSYPLFVSRRTLARYRRVRRATNDWALDSGGFSELSMYGEWRTRAADYVREVRRYDREIGLLAWAAPQDWMCEPFILAKTGRSVAYHQDATVANFGELRALAPDLPFVPVLQGYTLREYDRCLDMYAGAGVDLWAWPVVGVGSVCRRQSTAEIGAIFSYLAAAGLRLHGFGVKRAGLALYGEHLASADSLAWSFTARHQAPLRGHGGRHINCANCREYAELWRLETLAESGHPAPKTLH